MKLEIYGKEKKGHSRQRGVELHARRHLEVLVTARPFLFSFSGHTMTEGSVPLQRRQW